MVFNLILPERIISITSESLERYVENDTLEDNVSRLLDQLYLISPAILSTYRGPQTARLSQFISELQPKVYKKSSVKFTYKKNRNNKRGFQTASDLL